MKKFFGILMLAVTLLSGITVLAQNKNGSMKGNNMGSSRRRHHRRHHRRWHRTGGMKTGNKNKH